jgi:hypothetical protein
VGLFSNGFVFTTQPDFDAATRAIPDRFARGYKHTQHSVWLLDLWKPRGKQSERRSHFCDPLPENYRTDLSLVDAATRALLAKVEHLGQTSEEEFGPVVAGIHLTVDVASAAGIPAFFFAADDEELDMACQAIPGTLDTLGCRLGDLALNYSRGRITVTPLKHLEDTDADLVEEAIEAASQVEGVFISEPREIENGLKLYENPTAFWPKAAGNPAEILAIGTWDVYTNLESDFAVVFEKLDC